MAQENQNGGSVTVEAVKPVVFTAVKPQIFVEAPKASDAIQFYKTAFGAEEVNRVVHPKRKAEQELPLILSAELKLGSFVILVSDLVSDDSDALVKILGTGTVFCLETEEVEAAVEKAVKAGASQEGEITEGCCGGAGIKLKDPYGNVWLICAPAKKSATANVETICALVNKSDAALEA